MTASSYMDGASNRRATPFVSVLIPTRGRPALCLESVQSLIDTAARPEGVELLFRRDVSDQVVYPYAELFKVIQRSAGAVSLWGAARGYRGLHTYYNELASNASGTWLLVWNDDAIMRTPKWDEILDTATPYASSRPRLAQHHSHFPAITRRWWQRVGHVAMSPHADTYLAQVAETLLSRGVSNAPAPATSPAWDIEHRADQLDDEGSERRRQEVLGPEGTSAAFFTKAMRDQIAQDALCLSESGLHDL